jgi:hypothetical protein
MSRLKAVVFRGQEAVAQLLHALLFYATRLLAAYERLVGALAGAVVGSVEGLCQGLKAGAPAPLPPPLPPATPVDSAAEPLTSVVPSGKDGAVHAPRPARPPVQVAVVTAAATMAPTVAAPPQKPAVPAKTPEPRTPVRQHPLPAPAHSPADSRPPAVTQLASFPVPVGSHPSSVASTKGEDEEPHAPAGAAAAVGPSPLKPKGVVDGFPANPPTAEAEKTSGPSTPLQVSAHTCSCSVL